MFDTHCHLNITPLFEDHKKTIQDARNNGVDYILIPSTNVNTIKRAIEIADNFQNVYASVGFHPTETLDIETIEEKESILSKTIKNTENIVAIGETGLDYYRFSTSPQIQQEFLRLHIKLAAKHGLGLILHNRVATNDLIKALNNDWSPSLSGKTVFHCCPPEYELLDYAKEKEIFVGVDGDVTYDKDKMDFIKKVPIELLVIETDSPYLTPDPIRKTKKFPNKPENIKYLAEKVSELKEISFDEVINRTTMNGKRLFDII
jgi:TatD DNase family protein